MEPTPVTRIPFERLQPSPLNPRRHFRPEDTAELATSIATDGILQNLVVRPAKENGHYEIAAGHRRYLAFELLIEQGKRKPGDGLPCAIRGITDLELLRIATSENVRRRDLTPLEEADAFAAMIDKGDTVENIAAVLGMKPKTVEQRLTIARSASSGTPAMKKKKGPTLPLTGAHVIWAQHVKTRAFQSAIAEHSDVATALTIVSLIQARADDYTLSIGTKRMDGPSYTFANPELNKRLMVALRPLNRLLDYIPNDGDSALDVHLKDGAAAAAFRIIYGMKPIDRRVLFNTVVAARCGAWPRNDGKTYGDVPLVMQVCKQIDLEWVEFDIDQTYLERLSRKQLYRVAVDTGIGAGEARQLVSKRRAEAIAAILAHADRTKITLPELVFADEKTMLANLTVPTASAKKAKKRSRK
ncbi:MAG: ParB/RepB/Spo0J family partition protein [Stellaceae bacterium]